MLLTLPWAGCQFVREMESALEHGQAQSLRASARAVATVLMDRPELIYPNTERRLAENNAQPGPSLYATTSSAPIIVDGYDDGWDGPDHLQFGPIRYRSRTRDGRLYLLLQITDHEVIYHDPKLLDRVSGDRLLLRTDRDYIISTAAPGPVQARLLNSRIGGPDLMGNWESRIRGHWQDTQDGFSIELEMPLSALHGRLGFSLINVDGDGNETHFGNLESNRPAPWLIYPPRALQALVTPFSSVALRLSVIDRDRWVVSQAGQPGAAVAGTKTPWLLRAIYRAILNKDPPPAPTAAAIYGQQAGPEVEGALGGNSAVGSYRLTAGGEQKLILAAAPIVSDGKVIGALLAEQNSEQYLSLTDQAFSQLLFISLLAMLASALGLIGYASWLSWRIRQLSQASANAIGADGQIRAEFPASSAKDELGELARQHAQLLLRLREYNEYLRSLSRKLSHELRTPIAVIQSSLDNLEHNDSDRNVYLPRARQGLARLAGILTSMAEANRLEESLYSNALEPFDLAELCRQLHAAYRQIYPQQQITLSGADTALLVHGSADLVAQAMDKLLDNAASFSREGSRITISVHKTDTDIIVQVSNEGPALPAHMQQQLFDSMVSVREQRDDVHLGLGLHIVKLIMEYHAGQVQAANRDDGKGVTFSLCFRA
ncbi:ATP-binding protein [Candidatus Litorirhabdus singularis]|uniref:ATP-binding protein n=1 Tax=Candidatus Litorirhabdus singularis TaxID=2518993 RepID=UPI00242E78D2|nr:ATP-binding protein [Candidatus Litorirhabdus singularis]